MEFNEVQKFRSIWLWLLLSLSAIVTLGPLLYGFFQQIVKGQPYGDHPMSDMALLVTLTLVALVFAGLLWLFRTTALWSRINREEIRFRFKPFQTKAKVIRWEEIASYELETFKPMSQYGGWGVRMTSGGMAYIVQGNQGLKLLLKNGKSILLGTQKEKELAEFLKTLP